MTRVMSKITIKVFGISQGALWLLRMLASGVYITKVGRQFNIQAYEESRRVGCLEYWFCTQDGCR